MTFDTEQSEEGALYILLRKPGQRKIENPRCRQLVRAGRTRNARFAPQAVLEKLSSFPLFLL